LSRRFIRGSNHGDDFVQPDSGSSTAPRTLAVERDELMRAGSVANLTERGPE
jgi:hypothetical protein